MKREKYFRDELQHMFIGYAILPATFFTLACGIVLMAVLLHGRSSAGREQNAYAASELNRILEGYETGLDEMAALPGIFEENPAMEQRSEAFEIFYDISNELGYEAELFVLDEERRICLSNSERLPDYISVPQPADWGIFRTMDSSPGKPVVRLMDGWKEQGGSIVLGRSVTADEARMANVRGAAEKGWSGREAVSAPDTIGYVIFALDGRSLQTMLDRAEAQTIITDRFGWVFFGGNDDFLTESNQITGALEKSGNYLSYGGHLYLVSRQTAFRGMFRVYTISDIQSVVASLAMGGALVITALGLMTCWVLMSARMVTEKKTEDLYKILDVMENAREGKLDSVISIDSENEFRIIADAFNETISSLKRQMENNRKMTELVALSQNKQLESQFNPHFLYNTLENIRYMCKLEPATAEHMVFSLSNLLRYSLDNSRAEVTLAEDLEHLKNYLTILEYRFGSRFAYQIDVEPETLKCQVPRLMLQPMIENAVKYGFGNQPNLRVELKGYIHQEKLIMICRDDGVGMPQAVLSELTALLDQKENTSRHSGLYNIHRRIFLLYGRPYGVEIRSTEGHGTTLVVTLPAREEEEE